MKLVKWSAVLLVSTATAAWLFLALPVFSDVRSAFLADVLTRQIGQTVIVNGDAQVFLGLPTRVRVRGVVIPSENIEGTALATLEQLELDVDLPTLLGGRLDFDNLRMDGATVRLITLNDGTTSWSDADGLPDSDGPAADEAEEGDGILAFLGDKTLAFSSIQLFASDLRTGFQFDFDLEEFALLQMDDGRLTTLAGNGEMNRKAFKIQGTFPRRAPFSLHANIGEMRISVDGRLLPADEGGGHSGRVNFDTGDLGDFLEAIGLAREQEGRIRLAAGFLYRPGLMRIDGLDGAVELAGAGEATITGSVGNFWTADDFDFFAKVRLQPEGAPPPAAIKFADLQLSGFEGRIVSEDGRARIENMVLRTNALDQTLTKIGPVSIGGIRRSPDDRLVLADIRLQVGPTEAPYLAVAGDIRDALKLRDYSFDGNASVPVSLLVANLSDDAGAFGRLEGDFSINDADGNFGVKRMQARSAGTDLWTLDASAAFPDKTAPTANAVLKFAIPDSAAFLGGLGLKPVETGGFALQAALDSRRSEVETNIRATAGTTQLVLALDFSFAEVVPIVRGSLTSERLDLADLGNATAFLVQLARIGEGVPMEAGREVEPLVMEDPREVQPLVQGDAREVEPLVLPKNEGISALVALFDPETLVREADVQIAIEIPQIVGQKGISKLSSSIVAVNGKVQFGPIDLNYGGASLSLLAGMDVIDSPRSITISGSTRGWQLGEILRAVGTEIDARGVLNGQFNLTGRFASPLTFARSASGRARVSMKQGAIATSLLELAGLGIFPWLFSSELWRGYTNITCLEAPLQIQRGTISSNSVVLETERVQLVIQGMVDLAGDRISLRAEPRPVGKPLDRSAFPFEITGRLSAPDFNLTDTGFDRHLRARMPANRIPCKPDALQVQ